MPNKIVFMFSGQGSQYYQMGRQLFDEQPLFRQWMTRLDDIVWTESGHSAVAAIYAREKSAPFDRTLLTHPAIFMVEYSLAQCLIQAGVEPDLCMGASMGSFAAAAVAGHIGVNDALRAVCAQARAVEAHCPPGGMLAVLAAPELYDLGFMRSRSEMAGINFAGHFAVSGAPDDLSDIAAELDKRGVTQQRLAVSFAFHSRAIDAAEKPFMASARALVHRRGRVPLVCCEQAAALDELPDDYFWRVVRRPMRFHETLIGLERQGPHRYIDVGPSGTMATFVKYGLPAASGSSVRPVLTPYGRDTSNMAALLAGHAAGAR